MQRNCHERERKFEGSYQHMRSKSQVNCAESRSRDHDFDCDEVGLVVQHVLSAGVKISPRGNWIVDSGATCHICNDHNSFVELCNLKKTLDVTLGDGHTLKAIGRGTVILMMKNGCLTRKCKLHEILYVPSLTCNLLSVSKAVEKGISVTFNECGCVIKDAKHRLITVVSWKSLLCDVC